MKVLILSSFYSDKKDMTIVEVAPCSEDKEVFGKSQTLFFDGEREYEPMEIRDCKVDISFGKIAIVDII